jgi:hypothetical protein
MLDTYRSQDIHLAVFSVRDKPFLDRVIAVCDPDIAYIDNADVIRRAMIPQTLGKRARK